MRRLLCLFGKHQYTGRVAWSPMVWMQQCACGKMWNTLDPQPPSPQP